jgi:uncharacterized membrane protein
MNKKNTNIVTIILLVLTLIGIIVSYNSLPEIIPTHWGIDGKIDRMGSKSTLWILYGVMLAINMLFIIIAKIDPKKHNYKIFEKSYSVFRIIFNIFFMAILVLMILAGKGNTTFDTTRSIMFLTGLLFAIIGNYLPKFKPNYTTGIKTPWTLANENVWKKTHRIAGPIWVIGGMISAIASLIVNINLTIIVFIIIVVILVIIPTVYSYIAFKQEPKNNI